jgi:AraC-like DNA-binding protein
VDFSDQVISGEEVWDHSITTLYERLHVVPTPIQGIAIIQDWLMNQWRVPDHYAAIRYIEDQIRRANGDLSIADVVEKIAISQRHVERLFASYVGFTPKQYARIVRFQQVARRIYLGGLPPTLTTLAVESGYHDHSHLNRDFKRFTGLSPSQYLALHHEVTRVYFEGSSSVDFLQASSGISEYDAFNVNRDPTRSAK